MHVTTRYKICTVAGDQFNLGDRLKKADKRKTNLGIPPPHKFVLFDRVRVEFGDGLVSGVGQEGTEDSVADDVGDGPAGEGAEPACSFVNPLTMKREGRWDIGKD